MKNTYLTKEEINNKLRDLYLVKSPDEKDMVTESITFTWGTFQPKQKNFEFYIATKNGIEDFINSTRLTDLRAIREFVEGKKKGFEAKDVTVENMKSTALAAKYNNNVGYDIALSDILEYLSGLEK